jgi:cation/acetate symporter
MEPLPIAIVCVLIAATLGITAWAKRRNLDTGDHYVAGRRLSGWQNGLALTGDQISAASFLGITGAVALTGMTGFMLGIGLSAAFLLILLLVAEPLRNLGRFTLADAVATRFEGRALRGSIAVTTLVLSTVFMVVQFIGSGLVASALLDVDFAVAVVVLGGLMTLYTVVGGMVGATYIQIFKTSLLIVMISTLFLVVISRTGWNPVGPLKEATARLGDEAARVSRADSTTSWNFISLNMGLVLGMMGMPHIMLRFLTVRDGRAARTSAQVAMWVFAVFFLLLPIFGFAASNEVGRDVIAAANPAGNTAAPQLAQAVGGDVLFALVAGVVIATVLAVLAGLAIAASGAAAHDLYTNIIKRGEVDERRQLQVSRLAGAGIAVVAILLALGAKDLNVAFVGNVAFAIAAATTMPVVVLSIYWRGFNRTGATTGIVSGLVLSLVLVALGPDVLGKDDAIWPLSIPAIVTIPFAFLMCWLGSRIGRNNPDAQGMPWEEFSARAFPSRHRDGARFEKRPEPVRSFR